MNSQYEGSNSRSSNLSLEVQTLRDSTGTWKGTVPVLTLPSGTWRGEKALLAKKKKPIKVFNCSIAVSISHLEVAAISVCRLGVLASKPARYLCRARVGAKTYMQTPLGGFFLH